MEKKHKKIALLAAIGAISAYRAYKGKGVFNKYRFREQHEVMGNYIDTHYPNSFYSAIEKTDEGFRTIVTTPEKKVLIYAIPTDAGYVFEEKILN